ncbi:MAG: TldD/PmbA family protein [Bacteroidales bacterium]|nr:TldD/PmbA family protein [Bacteroidales bacterium]
MELTAEGILTPQELAVARKALEIAQAKGAQQCRITLSKSLMDLYGTLDGELDKVSHCLDRAMSVALFVDGRFGSFSTNRLDPEALDGFIGKAVATVRMLAEDPARSLPAPERTCRDAGDGDVLGICDREGLSSLTPERRLHMALEASCFGKVESEGWHLVSEEGEYSDSIADIYLIDSNGTECRQTDTSFEYGVEVTLEAADGHKYSGYWWDASPQLSALDCNACGRKAVERAAAKIGPGPAEGGARNMVVESECASKLLVPVLNALGGYALQQKNSFLQESLGKQLFPEHLTVMDLPREQGRSGARMFDSEGVATANRPVIENGTVRNYFVNTYIANKTGMTPTADDVTRACIRPTCDRDVQGLMETAGSGILVTGFNGGNCNSATGDFSYGIEGMAFEDGRIVAPVHEMVITGNMVTLWNSLAAVGNDARRCMARQVPSLLFKDVDFSA